MPTDTPRTPRPVEGDRPADLVAARDAARLVDRSTSTVRAWVRAGHLTPWREVAGDTGSRLLVSKAELMAHALTLRPDPPRPDAHQVEAAPEISTVGPAVDLATARAELDGARALLASVERERDAARVAADALVASERARADLAERRAAELRDDLDLVRAELDGARAELAALRTAAGLPWWRRLLGGPVAALPDPDTH